MGAHADIGPLTRQLVDEEDQGANAAAQGAVGAALLLLDDLLEALLHLPGDDQLVGLLVVDEVGGDDGAQGFLGHQAAGLVGNAQLRAHLGGGAARVAAVQDLLPEAPAHGQEWVVRHVARVVLGARGDPRGLELAADLARVLGDQVVNRALGLLLLLQHDGAHHLLDVVVLQVDLGGEAAHEPLQRGGIGECALPGADHQHAAVQLFGEGLDHLLHVVGDVGIVVDELLDLVQDHHGAGQLTVAGDGAAQRGKHLVDADLVHLRGVLGAQRLADVGGAAQVRVARQVSLVQGL